MSLMAMIPALYPWLLLAALVISGLTLLFEPRNGHPQRRKYLRNFLLLLLVLLIVWLCYLSFALSLTLIVLIMGVIYLIDQLFFHKARRQTGRAEPVIVEYSRSLFLVLLVVWVIRSFLIQPYRVPTGSLEPTVRPGELIAVNQFAYGVRFPVLRKKLISVGEPKHGDIVLFHWPADPKVLFVKRVVGLPGDHLVYKDKVLYINGKEMTQKLIGSGEDNEPNETPIHVELKQEDLMGVKHDIYVRKVGGETGNFDITVPKGMYFMMGDNRDDSDDSRFWGFVPERDLVGKAFIVWMSWDPFKHTVRWHRIGTWLD